MVAWRHMYFSFLQFGGLLRVGLTPRWCYTTARQLWILFGAGEKHEKHCHKYTMQAYFLWQVLLFRVQRVKVGTIDNRLVCIGSETIFFHKEYRAQYMDMCGCHEGGEYRQLSFFLPVLANCRILQWLHSHIMPNGGHWCLDLHVNIRKPWKWSLLLYTTS